MKFLTRPFDSLSSLKDVEESLDVVAESVDEASGSLEKVKRMGKRTNEIEIRYAISLESLLDLRVLSFMGLLDRKIEPGVVKAPAETRYYSIYNHDTFCLNIINREICDFEDCCRLQRPTKI